MVCNSHFLNVEEMRSSDYLAKIIFHSVNLPQFPFFYHIKAKLILLIIINKNNIIGFFNTLITRSFSLINSFPHFPISIQS